MIRVNFNVVELTTTLHYNFTLLIYVFIFYYMEDLSSQQHLLKDLTFPQWYLILCYIERSTHTCFLIVLCTLG